MRRAPASLLLAAFAVVAACGGGASPTPGTQVPATPTPAPAAATPAPATPAPTAAPATPAPTAAPATQPAAVVPVVACETSYGIEPEPTTLPADAQVALAAAVAARLSVYANDVDRVLGPRGWRCEAQVGVDGGSTMRVSDPNDTKAAVTLYADPVCFGCALGLACPLFPAAAETLKSEFSSDCPTVVPSRETTEAVSSTIIRFDDPPRVTGTGDGSGGPYRATGYLYFSGVDAPAAAKVTCAVADADADLCPAVLADWLARRQP